jgi:AcrR family transcriptional regulator
MPIDGRTQAERRADTRRRLLEAATTVFAERGFHAASVVEIAEAASVSTGALYANFASKEELFVAVMDEFADWTRAVFEGLDSREERQRAWIAYLEQGPERFLLLVELWAYIMRTPKMRPRWSRFTRELTAAIAERVESDAQASGRTLPMPAEQMALAARIFSSGLAFEKLADPESIPDDLFPRVMELLFAEPSG